MFAAHGIRGLLVTTAVVGAAKAARAAALAATAPDTIVVADDIAQVAVLDRAAADAGVTLRVAVDLYFGRTGVAPGAPALAVAHGHRGGAAPGLRRACRPTTPPPRTPSAWRRGGPAPPAPWPRPWPPGTCSRPTASPARWCRRARPAATASTPAIDGLTELQPGSFIFMDTDYLQIGGAGGGEAYDDFRPALSVVTTVVSVHGDEAIVDGGYKAFSTDRPFAPRGRRTGPDLTYTWAGDEHGRIDMRRAARRLAVGDRLEFRAPHCDPDRESLRRDPRPARRRRRSRVVDCRARQESVGART